MAAASSASVGAAMVRPLRASAATASGVHAMYPGASAVLAVSSKIIHSGRSWSAAMPAPIA